MKGKGGIIGLTKSPVALQCWLICGPELARCIFQSEIEYGKISSTDFLHHQEGIISQKKLKQQVNCLVDVISGLGNPFEDDCSLFVHMIQLLKR